MLDQIGLKYLFTREEVDYSYRGGDKTTDGKNFVQYYESILNPLIDRPIRFLEIGVWTGCSIAMWSEYFSNGIIYGIDCHLSTFKKCAPILSNKGAFKDKTLSIYSFHQLLKGEGRLNLNDEGPPEGSVQSLENKNNPLESDVNLFECNTLKKQFVYLVLNCLPQFDIILDDGNHTSLSQYRNFKILFNYMNPNGIYIIEDIENRSQFFSYKYFGYIIQLFNGQSIDSIREDYYKIKYQNHKSKCTNLKNKLLKINLAINKAPKNIEYLIKTKQDLEKSLSDRDIDMEPVIHLKFDKLLLSKQLLVEQISKIEDRKDHIIFFKK